jgi:hypothetical protein
MAGSQLERAAGIRREDTDEQRLDKLEAVLAQSTKLTREIPRLRRGGSKCLTFPAVAPPGTYRRNFEREPPSTRSEPDRWTTHGRA